MNSEEARDDYEKWLTTTPLYKELADDENSRVLAFMNLATRTRPFDMYCVECRSLSTFKSVKDDGLVRTNSTAFSHNLRSAQPPFIGQFNVTVTCARDAEHIARFLFLYLQGKTLQKIGQYPSLADISKPETAQFVKVLGKDRVNELNKAIGLAAHSVGAGSYIYLRRIFESLVEEAHVEAQKDDGWNEEAYQQLRVVERVALLKSHLPAFLVEHRQLYGILSKHIHELSEEECLQNFDAMKEAILIIAYDKLQALEEQEQRDRTSKLLQKIGSTMKDKGQ